MKKIIMIIITSIFLVVTSSRVYGLDYNDLGDFRSVDSYYCYNGNSVITISVLCFQFGIIIRGFPPGDIIYLYGQEDLPGMGKSSNELKTNYENISSTNDIYVDVYDISNIMNPISVKHKRIRKDISNDIQNLNLDLRSGKLYIMVFRNTTGAVLEIKKIAMIK